MMRSLLVASLFVHAEAQTPETVDEPQNITSSDTNASQKELQQQAAFGNKMRTKYMKEYAGSYAFPGHNDTFDANGSMTKESQDWYKHYFENKYSHIGTDDGFGSNGGSFDYQKYLEEYTGNNSMGGIYMDKYASEFMPPQGNGSGVADFKDYFMEKYGMAGNATVLASLAEGMPRNITSSDTNASQKELQQQAAFGNKMRNKYMKEYAGSYAFPGHNDTFDANGSMTKESQDWYKNYFENKYSHIGTDDGFGSDAGSFDYQKYLEEYTGNNSMGGVYIGKYASEFMPPQGNGSGFADFKDYFMEKYGMAGNATALASSVERGTSPWVLLLCALAGASIPVAFAAAWRRQRLESSEESTHFLLLA